MARIITISNHKGGVGKTTSAINIGAGLSQLGYSVLLIDMDPQANLTQSLGINEPTRTVYGALMGQYSLTPMSIIEKPKGTLDLVPSTLDLSGAEVELSTKPGRERVLSRFTDMIKSFYDYIIIDSPPSLGLLTVNALIASTELLIPLQPHYLAFQGLTKLSEVVERIQHKLNPDLKLTGIFVTQYDSRKILIRQVVSTIEAHYRTKMMDTRIRENIALAEAPAMGLDIFRYNPKSNGAEDYLSLCREIETRDPSIPGK